MPSNIHVGIKQDETGIGPSNIESYSSALFDPMRIGWSQISTLKSQKNKKEERTQDETGEIRFISTIIRR